MGHTYILKITCCRFEIKIYWELCILSGSTRKYHNDFFLYQNKYFLKSHSGIF